MLTPLQLSNSRHKIAKWFLLAFLTVALIVIGFEEASIKVIIAKLYNNLLYFIFKSEFFHSPFYSKHLSVFTSISKRLINLVYRIIYCGVCLLIIQKYFNNKIVTKIVLSMYLSAALLYLFLIGFAKLLQFHPFIMVAFRIDTLIVSPMPIILMIPAFSLAISSQKHTRETQK